MTTTSAAGFTVGSQASRPNSLNWASVSNLLNTSPGSYAGPGTLYKTGSYVALLSVPDYITDIAYGSEFESLKVTFQAKVSSGSSYEYYARLTDGTWFDGNLTTSYQTFTLDGDKSYWGISGTAHSIFRDLKDGDLKFAIYLTGGVGDTVYLKDVEATLTYKEADTARAAIITTIP